MDQNLIIQILLGVREVVSLLLTIFTWGLLIYILSSWIPGLRESSFGEILGKVYEPVLEPIRNLIPPLGGMLDLSPIILFIVLRLFRMGLDAVFVKLIEFVVAM